MIDDHAALVAYLLSAVRRADWHAVSDAANDLRVLEAKRDLTAYVNALLEKSPLDRNEAGGDKLPSEKP